MEVNLLLNFYKKHGQKLLDFPEHLIPNMLYMISHKKSMDNLKHFDNLIHFLFTKLIILFPQNTVLV